ncbi:MAG: transglutaminase family protein [Chloroflexaceae bacterium]|nr:transglutaminase family protein [Chloroflexaceae bacterium]
MKYATEPYTDSHPEVIPVSVPRSYFSIRHMTRFRYSHSITESAMEVWMKPRTEDRQRCLQFSLITDPQAEVFSYVDHLGNTVHHFNVPGRHVQLTITAEAIIETAVVEPLPAALNPATWATYDEPDVHNAHLDFLLPSAFARPSSVLAKFQRELELFRMDDPLTTLLIMNKRLYDAFDYVPHSTRVDSPIEDALSRRRGVCQDFAHIMITLVRALGIPCRYVSGYLFHGVEDHDRSEEDATHAWLEAWLPTLGWVGFDPTNNLVVRDRHIRTAIGRDYQDVPPTRGVFRGTAESELDVGVRVSPSAAPIAPSEDLLPEIEWDPAEVLAQELLLEQQQQQQQQQ